MATTMQGAFFLGPNEMALREVSVPVPGPSEVLLRVGACAVCGTDLRILSGGKTRGVVPPRVLGHEIAATVVAHGDGAEAITGVPVGTRVTLPPGITCGACRFCVIGLENHCTRREAFGYKYDGGFAEYMLVPAHAARRRLRIDLAVALNDGAVKAAVQVRVRGRGVIVVVAAGADMPVAQDSSASSRLQAA